MKIISVISLGCPKNAVDTEVTLGFLFQAGYTFTSDWRAADVILLNTCAFIESARAEARKNIQEMIKFKNHHPDKKLIVFGCLPQLKMAELKIEFPEIDGWLGVGVAAELPGLLKKLEKGKITFKNEKPVYLYTEAQPRILTAVDDGNKGAALPGWAYLKISEGCSNFCSYCLVPKIRGAHRSRTMESITSEAERLAAAGVKEIILVGQDTTAYGRDLYGKNSLPELLRRLVKINMVKWLRILYNHPEKVSDELIKVVAGEPKICRYFDLPFQHVSERILRGMGRRGNMNMFLDLLKKIRKYVKGVTVRSSFIIGFPGEESRDQNLLLEFLTEAEIDRAGFFIYSREPQTPAGRMAQQVPDELKKARFEQAYRKQSRISLARNKKLIGARTEVLVEGKSSGRYFGRTRQDAPDIDGKIFLTVKNHRVLIPGQMVPALITGARTYDLVGEAIR